MIKLYFQINSGSPVELSELEEGQDFIISFTPNAESNKDEVNHYLLMLQDEEGNKVKIYSKPS